MKKMVTNRQIMLFLLGFICESVVCQNYAQPGPQTYNNSYGKPNYPQPSPNPYGRPNYAPPVQNQPIIPPPPPITYLPTTIRYDTLVSDLDIGHSQCKPIISSTGCNLQPQPINDGGALDGVASEFFTFAGEQYIAIGGGNDYGIVVRRFQPHKTPAVSEDIVEKVYIEGSVTDMKVIAPTPEYIYLVVTVRGAKSYVFQVAAGENYDIKLTLIYRLSQGGLNRICPYAPDSDGITVVFSNYDSSCLSSRDPYCSLAPVYRFDTYGANFMTYVNSQYTVDCAVFESSSLVATTATALGAKIPVNKYVVLIERDLNSGGLNRILTSRLLKRSNRMLSVPVLNKVTIADEPWWIMQRLISSTQGGTLPITKGRLCNVRQCQVVVLHDLNYGAQVHLVCVIGGSFLEEGEFPSNRILVDDSASVGDVVAKEGICANSPRTVFSAQWDANTEQFHRLTCWAGRETIDQTSSINIDTIKVLQTPCCNLLLTGSVAKKGEVWTTTCESPQAAVVSGGNEQVAELIDAKTGTPCTLQIKTLPQHTYPLPSGVCHIQPYAASGRFYAALSSKMPIGSIWDMGCQEQVYQPPAPPAPAYPPPVYPPPVYSPPAYSPPAYSPPAYSPPAYSPPEQPTNYAQPNYYNSSAPQKPEPYPPQPYQDEERNEPPYRAPRKSSKRRGSRKKNRY